MRQTTASLMPYRIGSSLMTLLLVSTVAAACGSTQDDDTGGSTVNDFQAEVAYIEERPFSYREGGNWVGFLPEILNTVFENMGVEVTAENGADFSGVIPGLQAGRHNVIGTALYITSERCEQVAFTDPIFVSADRVATAPGVEVDVEDYEAVKANPDINLGLVQGASQVQIATDLGVPDSQVTILPDVASTLEALKTGRIDATIMDSIGLEFAIENSSGTDGIRLYEPFLPVVDGKEQVFGIAFLFPKDESEMLEAFNQAQRELAESGELVKMMEPYVAEDQVTTALEMTAPQLCQELS